MCVCVCVQRRGLRTKPQGSPELTMKYESIECFLYALPRYSDLILKGTLIMKWVLSLSHLTEGETEFPRVK